MLQQSLRGFFLADTNVARSMSKANVAARRKKLNQEAMRDKMSFTRICNRIKEVEEELISGVDKEGLELSPARVASLKTVADIQFKKMNKILPDLRAVQINADGQSSSKSIPISATIELLEHAIRSTASATGEELGKVGSVLSAEVCPQAGRRGTPLVIDQVPGSTGES